MRKEITFYVFLGEKRDPSEIYANTNLRNVTHITQKPSYVYTFFTYTLKEITASAQISWKKSPFFFDVAKRPAFPQPPANRFKN